MMKKTAEMTCCYFCKNDILLNKWTTPFVPTHDDCRMVNQIVVQQKFRSEILRLADDNPLASHLAIAKTYHRILCQFFWPGFKRDVKQYCKFYQICKVLGKPN